MFRINDISPSIFYENNLTLLFINKLNKKNSIMSLSVSIYIVGFLVIKENVVQHFTDW